MAEFLDYGLDVSGISANSLKKLEQERNISFNNRVQHTFEQSYDTEMRSAVDAAINKGISYLNDEDKETFYSSMASASHDDFGNSEQLSFWKERSDSIAEAMKNNGVAQSEIDSFQAAWQNWDAYQQSETKRESIHEKIQEVQTEISSLQQKMDSLDKKSPDYVFQSLNLQNELDYQKSIESNYQNDLKATYTDYSFDTKEKYYDFLDMLDQNNIPHAAQEYKVNGQFVVVTDSGFTPQIKELASHYEDMTLDTYREKWVDPNVKTTDEHGDLRFDDENASYKPMDSLAYTAVADPVLSNCREVSVAVSYANRIVQWNKDIDDGEEPYHSIFSHSSVHDSAYEQNFSVIENQEKRLEFVEKKYGISREELLTSTEGKNTTFFTRTTGEDGDSVDVRTLGKSEYEKYELGHFVRDRDTLKMLSDKYGLKYDKNMTMTEFSLSLNNANAKLLTSLQDKLVLNGQSMIVNGRLDVGMLRKSGLTAEKLGISKEEFKFLKDFSGQPVSNCAILGSGMALMAKVMQKAGKYGEGADYSWYFEIQRNIRRGTKVYNTSKKVVKYIKQIDLSDFRMQLKNKKRANVNRKKKNKVNQTKKEVKKKEVNVVGKKKNEIEAARKKEEKRLLAKQRFDKSWYGRLQKKFTGAKEYFLKKTAVGKAASLVSKAFTTALKFAAKWGIIAALFVTAFLTIIVDIAMIFFMLVPGFMEEPEYNETTLYSLYEYGMDLEDKWIASLSDTESFYKQRTDFAYGYNWYYWQKGDYNGTSNVNQFDRYVNLKVNHARTDLKSNVYINPFDFTPKDSKNTEHQVTKYDGGVEVGIISNFNIDYTADENGKITLGEDHWKYGGGHTCNVKDIICMLDVLMGFETTGDWTDQSLTDSIGQTEFKNAWGNIKHAGKCIGLGIASIFDDEAFGEWSEEMDAGSGTIGYYQLEAYMRGLFEASHQETLELEVVTFPVDTLADAKAPTKAAGGKEAGLQMALNDNVIRCPGGELDETYTDADGKEHEIHACEVYDGFKPFFYDMNKAGIATTIPPQFKFGLEGDDGKMHPVDNEVHFKSDEEFCLPSGLATANDFNTAFWENLFYTYKDNDHWEYEQGKDETKTNDKEYGELDDFDKDVVGGDTKSSYSFDRDFSNNSPNQYFTVTHTWYSFTTDTKEKVIGQKDVDYGHMEDCSGCQTIPVAPYIVCPYGGQHYVIDGYKKQDITENVTIYDIIKHTETLHWDLSTCEGHTGYYCGGHLRCHVTGIVYSMRGKDVAFVMGDLDDDSYVMEYPVHEVNYATADTAKKTLNINTDYDILSPNYSDVFDPTWKMATKYREGGELLNYMRLCEDIFDVDKNIILYGKQQFRYNDFRQYEGWTEDNKLIALSKYGQDWNDIYGFDVPTEIGFGEIPAKDIENLDKALYEKYGPIYNNVRKHVVNLALAAVGNGSYDSNPHHWHAYTATKHDGLTCTATDCSGFASYPLIQTERDLQIKLNTPNNSGGWAWSCSELAGFKVSGLKSVSQHEVSPYKDGTYVVNSDFSNCKPGDIISYVTGDEGAGNNHSVVFIGVLDEELELSDGKKIQPGEVLIVDCTTITEGGNIYFRGYADSGLIPWSTIKNWPSKYSKGDRQLWVRDITYGMEEE